MIGNGVVVLFNFLASRYNVLFKMTKSNLQMDEAWKWVLVK